MITDSFHVNNNQHAWNMKHYFSSNGLNEISSSMDFLNLRIKYAYNGAVDH